VLERETYLNESLIPTFKCSEDEFLPDKLIEDYIKNGTNLICPNGTESERGQWCLG